MKVDMNVSIFIECSHPEQSIRPNEHNADQSQPIQAKASGIQRDIILKISFDLVFIIHELVYQFIVDCTYNPQQTSEQAIKLLLVYTHPVLKVVDYEDKNRPEEVYRVYHRQRQVELRCTYSQHVEYHDRVSLEQVGKSYVVLVVERDVVVSGK
jgi:hypothetical protein